MTKRFTESEKFRNPWYRKLSPKHKCIWEYLLAECSLAGIIDIDYEAMGFHIGVQISEKDVSCIEEKLHKLPDGKYLVKSFIPFQQGRLNKNNRAHKNIIKELKKYGIPYDIELKEYLRGLEGASLTLQRGTSNSKGNSNSNSKGNSKRKNEKISLEELTVDHIQDWLIQKRVSGKYLTIDEHELLEKFKDYCLSKGKTYKDYVAAYRNAFKWNDAPIINRGKITSKGNANEELQRFLDTI